MVPYQRTTIDMGNVIAYMQGLSTPTEIKRAAYIIFRNESANGSSGINNNYLGVQADSGRWPEKFTPAIVGVVDKKENGTGNERLFVAFSAWQNSVDFMVDRVISRGLYVGGYAHLVAKMQINTPMDLAYAYTRDWVTGNRAAAPSGQALQNFLSMYTQSTIHFK